MANSGGWQGEASKLGFRLLQIATVVIVEEFARHLLNTAFEDDEQVVKYEKPRKRTTKVTRKKNTK